MPKISFDHTTSVAANEALVILKEFFSTDESLRRLDPKIQTHFQEDQLKGKVTGSQFKAEIQVASNGNGSRVTIVIDLPLLLTPFKGKVEETVKRKLSKHLA